MRIAAYCRVSTEKDEQLSSLENQKLFFEDYALKCGDTLVHIYADEGISGKSMKKRDAFMRMLEDAKSDRFDCVCVKDISRFARNTSDFLHGIRTLKSNNVDVRFLSANQTVIGESEFILTVFAALAQEESANLSKRVIFGKQQNAKKGRVPNIVYGYNKLDTFTLAINPDEGNIVRLIYKWYIDGDGCRRIAIKLNEMNIPTKKNAKWTSRTVRRILSNPIYTGVIVNNKTVTGDFISGSRADIPKDEWLIHPRPELRIISDSEFNLVSQKLTERRSQYKNQNPGNRYSSRHVFSNLIKCSECGGSFTARIYRQKKPCIRYRCAVHNNHGNSHCCNKVSVDENKLAEKIKLYLLSLITDEDSFSKKLTKQRSHPDNDIDLSKLETKKEALRKRKARLKEMYIAGLIDMSELEQEYHQIDDGIASIDNELASLHQSQENSTTINSELNIKQLLLSSKFTNEDMRAVIEYITVSPTDEVEVVMK